MGDPPDKQRPGRTRAAPDAQPTQLIDSQPNYQQPQHRSWPDYDPSGQSSSASHPDPGHGSNPDYQHPRYGSTPGAPAGVSRSQVIFQKYQQPGATPTGPAPSPPGFPDPVEPTAPGIPALPDDIGPSRTRSRDVYRTGDVSGPYSARRGAVRVTLPEPGEVLDDRYEIVAEIGVGGFGAVYKATQRGLDKPVALKVLLPQVASIEDAAARFRREAMLAKKLSHPNTISVFDYGQTDDGLTYIAMELLEGNTLEEELCDRGAMSVERVRRVTGQIMKSLAEAHANGIVHRDLKPSNIMLADVFGERDYVKVLDFGIARAFEDHAESFKTQTGTVIGTPQYMSPEQLRGGEVGPEADLYSTGLIMAEMLTGDPVFNEQNTNLVIVAQLSGQTVPIAESVLDGPLGEVVYRATSKESRLRYVSALKMLEALDASKPAPGRRERAERDRAAGGPVLHSVITKPRPAVQPRAKVALSLVLALVVLAGAATFWVTRPGEEGAPSGGADSEEPGHLAAVDSPAEASETRGADGALADRAGSIVANTVWRTASMVTLSATRAGEPPSGRVRLVVISNPLGAQVYRGGQRIGVTPFNADVDAGGETETLTVRRRGYVEQRLVVDLTRDAVPPTVVFERRPASSQSRQTAGEPPSAQPVIPLLDSIEPADEPAGSGTSEPAIPTL